jgi:hypothetical protein
MVNPDETEILRGPCRAYFARKNAVFDSTFAWYPSLFALFVRVFRLFLSDFYVFARENARFRCEISLPVSPFAHAAPSDRCPFAPRPRRSVAHSRRRLSPEAKLERRQIA